MNNKDDMNEFKDKFKELFPNDWEKIIRTYRKEETVALLGRKQVSDYLHIAVNTEDLETDVGRIYTNEDIKRYIEEKYGFKIHSAYIGQVKGKLGIREHE